MKAKYTGKYPYRDADHKFVPDQDYELTADELKKYAGKFEVINDKKAAKQEVDNGTAK